MANFGRKKLPTSRPIGCLFSLLGWFFDLTRFWIYILLFFALMAFCSYGVVSHYVRGKELQAPDLTGLSLDAGLARIGTRLSLSLEGHQAHPSVRKGLIISQKPEAGSRIKAGSPLKVTVSDGPPLVTVPDLRWRSAEGAATLLRRYNLKLGNEAYMAMPNKPGGLVITSDPPAKTGIVEGSAVNLLLTAGPAQSNVMPDLTGFTLDEVREMLSKRGLPEAVPHPRSVGGDAVPGQVVDQLPAAGQVMQPGMQITVYYEPQPAQPTATPTPAPEETPTPGREDEDVMPEPESGTQMYQAPAPASTEQNAEAPRSTPGANDENSEETEEGQTSTTDENQAQPETDQQRKLELNGEPLPEAGGAQ